MPPLAIAPMASSGCPGRQVSGPGTPRAEPRVVSPPQRPPGFRPWGARRRSHLNHRLGLGQVSGELSSGIDAIAEAHGKHSVSERPRLAAHRKHGLGCSSCLHTARGNRSTTWIYSAMLRIDAGCAVFVDVGRQVVRATAEEFDIEGEISCSGRLLCPRFRGGDSYRRGIIPHGTCQMGRENLELVENVRGMTEPRRRRATPSLGRSLEAPPPLARWWRERTGAPNVEDAGMRAMALTEACSGRLEPLDLRHRFRVPISCSSGCWRAACAAPICTSSMAT